MAKKLTRKAKAKVTGVARVGTAEARNIAGEALGAAAAAAAEVVLSRVAEGLSAGSRSVAASGTPQRLKGAVEQSVAGKRSSASRKKKRPAKAAARKSTAKKSGSGRSAKKASKRKASRKK